MEEKSKKEVKKNNTNKKITNKKKTSKKSIEKETKKNEKQIVEEEIVVQEPKQEKKSKKKLFIIVTIVSLLLVLITTLIILSPKIKEHFEIKEIKNKISNLVKDNEEYTIEEIEEKLKDKLLSGDKYEIEEKIENYFINSLKIKRNILAITNDDNIKNALNTSVLSNNISIDFYNNSKLELERLNEEYISLKEESSSYNNNNKKYQKLYNDLLDKINESFDDIKIDDTLLFIDKVIPILNYLNDNKNTYELKEDVIEFKKRVKKEQYDELIKEFESYENVSKTSLIEDTKGPFITANDITIYVGNKLDIKSKVKCVDEVDDEVECVINGTFNSSKEGVYNITIESSDKSNNKSTKAIKVNVKKQVARPNTNNKPYYIEVIRNQNVVIVYGLDEHKEYNKIVKVFVVSVGRNGKTPTGTYTTTRGYPWGSLIGGVYGQYSTRIYGSYLFHSVPYYSKNKGDLEWEEFNKLGTAASAGCVRMTVRDVKWIYDNIPNGTTVRIYDGNLPSGVSKPSATKIPADSPNRGWDPTDPDPNNPWH